MTGLLLLRPAWLLGLPVLLLVGLHLWRRGPDAGGWEQVMTPAMLSAMRALGHLATGRAQRRQTTALAAAALIVLGLSGPAVPRADAPVLAGAGAILIAVDMSPSVAAGPALADAQAAAAAVLAAARGRPVGLVLYAGEAYTVAAPTADPTSLETLIAVLSPETMPDRGSRPAAALALGRRMLEETPEADLVLVSDGGGFDEVAVAEAERLTGSGVRLLALTLSGAAGGDADPGALIANAVLSASARAPAPVLAALAKPVGLSATGTIASLHVHDLGPMIAGLAAFPLLLLFRRRG